MPPYLILAATLLLAGTAGGAPGHTAEVDEGGSGPGIEVLPPRDAGDRPPRFELHSPELSPRGALTVGIAATLAPVALAAAIAGPATDWGEGWWTTLGLVAPTAFLIGPAVGLWSGGRSDLGVKGLEARSGAEGVMAGGCAVGMMMYALDRSVGTAWLVAGGAGAAWTLVSCVHDLAITPSAVAQVRGPTTSLDLRPDGRLALTVRF
jgi:hypothetical protein